MEQRLDASNAKHGVELQFVQMSSARFAELGRMCAGWMLIDPSVLNVEAAQELVRDMRRAAQELISDKLARPARRPSIITRIWLAVLG